MRPSQVEARDEGPLSLLVTRDSSILEYVALPPRAWATRRHRKQVE